MMMYKKFRLNCPSQIKYYDGANQVLRARELEKKAFYDYF
jgi:hypothetical protein